MASSDKMFVLQGIRFLHAAQEYIHQFYQLFLALAAHRVAGEGIVRKTVHKGSITFAVHVKEDLLLGYFWQEDRMRCSIYGSYPVHPAAESGKSG